MAMFALSDDEAYPPGLRLNVSLVPCRGSNDPLRKCLAIIFGDLPNSLRQSFEVKVGDWVGNSEQLTASLWRADGTAGGVYILRGQSPAAQISALADQVQDLVVETLWSHGEPAVWPACPLHKPVHQLRAQIEGLRAVWVCPHTQDVVARIGDLTPANR